VDQRFADIGDGRREPEHGITAYADIEDALPRVDALVIATPPASHAPLALKAIAAGKHVLIEKPMATTTSAARMLIDAAAAAGVVLMPGHTFEHNAAVHKLRDLVRGGHLGRLFYLDCSRLNLGLYQSDVNVIFDLAPPGRHPSRSGGRATFTPSTRTSPTCGSITATWACGPTSMSAGWIRARCAG
jgi:hypothetical protein